MHDFSMAYLRYERTLVLFFLAVLPPLQVGGEVATDEAVAMSRVSDIGADVESGTVACVGGIDGSRRVRFYLRAGGAEGGEKSRGRCVCVCVCVRV